MESVVKGDSSIEVSIQVEDLARQIPVVGNEAEDVIDSHVVSEWESKARSSDHDAAAALSSFYQDLEKVIQKFDSIIKELTEVVNEELDDVKEPKLVADSLRTDASSSRVLPFSGENSTMVGFDDRLVQIIDELMRDESDLKILPVVGMGGLFFPDNGNRSRIVVTTRLSNVAISLGSKDPYLMDFLDEENYWNLHCVKVFGQGGCPHPELEQIGKDIAKGCRGLPLALVVISGVLAKSNMTLEYWESVAKNINSFVNSEHNEYCLKVLSLTYNSLPIHLKPCFLYMRVFPEDKIIKVFKLIRLWVAEGFIKLARGNILEEVAEAYLKDLIGMNLIFIGEWKTSGNIKSIRIHDLLRDLCLRESDEENFIRVSRVQRIYRIKKDRKCYLCHNEALSFVERIDVSEFHIGLQSTSVTTALVCKDCKSMYPDLMRLRWAKVFGRPRGEFMQHTRLRYIGIGNRYYDISFEKDIICSSTLPLLWNLQTLYIKSDNDISDIALPSEIWMMPQLKHINIPWVDLPGTVDAKDHTTTILENLQTLSIIRNLKCTKEVVKRIQNLKKLQVSYPDYLGQWSDFQLYNFADLHKLESLSLDAAYFPLKRINFPTSLKKLVLEDCEIPWEDMTIIGSFKLHSYAFKGPEWNPVEGEFLRLKVLVIQSCELVWWTTEDAHFPNLEVLSLIFLRVLKEIPSSIGDITTLKLIRLRNCSGHIEDSAKQILEEQQSNENESLQVEIYK
ncbi:UNVERIFIED_CONTAM: putative late blight resistance proteinR1A-10 [Sesamum latifolium]|uniref:Late blight resistance proteinR1A-10 n=1 Tax=Sesamum latifolium TaxID=2727402 RepID=A0AAW2XUQ6_9LAMI